MKLLRFSTFLTYWIYWVAIPEARTVPLSRVHCTHNSHLRRVSNVDCLLASTVPRKVELEDSLRRPLRQRFALHGILFCAGRLLSDTAEMSVHIYDPMYCVRAMRRQPTSNCSDYATHPQTHHGCLHCYHSISFDLVKCQPITWCVHSARRQPTSLSKNHLSSASCRLPVCVLYATVCLGAL